MSVDWHKLADIFGGGTLTGGLIWLIRVARTFGRIEGKIDSIASDVVEVKTNHIPHVEAEVKSVHEKLDRHLEWHSQGGKK